MLYEKLHRLILRDYVELRSTEKYVNAEPQTRMGPLSINKRGRWTALLQQHFTVSKNSLYF